MAFFKRLGLRIRAEKIAQGFQKLRNQQFDSTVRSLAGIIPQEDIVSSALGGEADSALKTFQLWVFTYFLSLHAYIPDAEFQEFAGHVKMAISGAWQEDELTYFEELHAIREDPADQALNVSLRVANYITSELNPVAAVIAAKLMPIFAINTQMVIADV